MGLLGDNEEKAPEIVMSPVGKSNPKQTVNKKGFVTGQIVGERDYFEAIAKARQAKQSKK